MIDPKFEPYMRSDGSIDWEAWNVSDEAKAEREEHERRLALPWEEWKALYEAKS